MPCIKEITSPKHIQPEENSTVWWHGWYIAQKRHADNSENVAYVYWNDDDRRWVQNWNWLDNDWNGNDRVLRRKFSHSPPIKFGGVSLEKLCSHLPSIRPICPSFSEMIAFLFSFIPFTCQRTVIKYFNVSSFLLNCCIAIMTLLN